MHLASKLENVVVFGAPNGGHAKGEVLGVVGGGGSVEEAVGAGEVAGLEAEGVGDGGRGSGGIGADRGWGDEVVAEANVGGFGRGIRG